MVRPKGRLRRSSRAIDARQRAHGDLDGATVNGAAAGAQQAADHRSSYIFGVEFLRNSYISSTSSISFLYGI
jgi:hypothetical protein